MSKRERIGIGGRMMAVAALLAAVTGGCGGGDEKPGGGGGAGGGPPATQPAREPVPVALAPVERGTMPETIDVVGTLFGDEEATISAKVSGRVQEILADVGDRVAPGEPLAQIDRTDYELVVRQREMSVLEALASLGLMQIPPADFDVSRVATVERAQFQSANAKARMERARQLFTQQPPLISEQEYTDLETAHQVAQQDYSVALLEARQQIAVAKARDSELGTARQRLADTTIRAPGRPGPATQPMAGPTTAPTTAPAGGRYAVTQRMANVGEYVGEGAPMYRLVADHPIKYRAAVPERFIPRVKTGQEVTLRIEGSDRPHVGRIARINPAIDVQTRTFQVEVIVPNEQNLLNPGAFARGVITTGERPNVVFVPRDAITSFAGIDRVFTVADGKAVEHRVTLLRRDGDRLPINEDLKGAEQVVTKGANRLAKDAPVTVGE